MKRFISCLVLAGFCLIACSALASDIKITGFGQWWYEYSDAAPWGTSKFTMKRMRFKPSYQMTDKVGFFTQFDFKAGPSVHLLDALLDVKLAPWMKLRAGQFCIPFGIETPSSPFNLDCISYSYVIGSGETVPMAAADTLGNPIIVYAGTGFFSGLREVGFQLKGKYDPVNYALAVMNGKGLTGGEDNKWKDITSRLGVSKAGVSGGASVYYGFVDNIMQANPDDSLWNKLIFGGDLKVDISNVLLKGEFIMGSLDTGDTLTDVSSMGYYVILGYTIPVSEYGPKEEGYMALQPIVRYDSWDPNSDVDDDEHARITAGTNFWFDKNTKVSAFYEVRTEGGDLDVKDDKFRLQLATAW